MKSSYGLDVCNAKAREIIKFPFKMNGLPCCEDANTFR